MKRKKSKSNPKTPKKDNSSEAGLRPAATALTATEGIMSQLLGRALAAVERQPQEAGKQILADLDLLSRVALTESAESGLSPEERAVEMEWIIGGVINRLAEVLRKIEKETADPRLRKVVQDQMVFAARTFSDAAFDVLHRYPDAASKIMVQELVKFIDGQQDRLKQVTLENPQALRWIAEANVFWPSRRGVYESFSDDFQKEKERLNLAGRLPINREPKREPDMEKAAFQEVSRFMIQVLTFDPTFSPPLPDSEGRGQATPWGKVFALPALPPLSEQTLGMWKARLDLYLEANKKRLMDSPAFEYVRLRAKTKKKEDNEPSIWTEIMRDCSETFVRMATSYFSDNTA